MIPLQTFSVPRPRQLSEVLVWEASAEYSRASGTLLAGALIDLGTPLAKLAAGGQLVPWNPAGNDGSQTIVGVSLEVVADAQATDVDGILYVDALAVLRASGMRWPAGLDAPGLAAGIAALRALGIKVRSY